VNLAPRKVAGEISRRDLSSPPRSTDFDANAAIPAKVGYEMEMPPQSLHVRYREQSGRHLLAASISPFDPVRTSAEKYLSLTVAPPSND
jgi:hypothetical protein